MPATLVPTRVRTAARGRRRVAVLVAVTTVLLTVGATVTAWALAGPKGAVGHDVSYPQCNTALPTSGSFGVVGVNGGKVSTANPCLSTQYAWAAKTSAGASLYANTGNPGAISTFYWPANGARDPALCTDRTSAADPGCAYDYGYHGAQDSIRIARSVIGSAATSREWWLDVELANSWNGTTTANAAALQGALDGFVAGGVSSVGIYSTAYQWGQITGGYTSAKAASYRSAWSSSFTPKRPLEQAPLWIAGLSSLDAASANCATSFTGGPTTLAQYTDGSFDGDLVCGGTPATTAPTTTSPSAPSPTTTTGPTTASSLPAPTSTLPAPTTTSSALPTTTLAPTTTSGPPATTAPLTSTALPTTTTPPPAARTPGAPTGLIAATDPTRGIDLRWGVPQTTGGSPVNRYAILRGAAQGRETVLGVITCRTSGCAFRDATVARGQLTYYQVVAINDANAVGPRSPEVSARAR